MRSPLRVGRPPRVPPQTPASVAASHGIENANVAPGPSFRVGPYASLVMLDDRAADRKPDSHSTDLCCVESVE